MTTPGEDPWKNITQALGSDAADADALADELGARVEKDRCGVVLLVDQLEH